MKARSDRTENNLRTEIFGTKELKHAEKPSTRRRTKRKKKSKVENASYHTLVFYFSLHSKQLKIFLLLFYVNLADF